MRSKILAVSAAALALSSCGPKQLALPNNPVDRAATWAVVSAAEARLQSPEAKVDLDFNAQTVINHYAKLGASEGRNFSAKQATAVVNRMGELEADINNAKWQDLVAPCNQAYPAVKKTAGIE